MTLTTDPSASCEKVAPAFRKNDALFYRRSIGFNPKSGFHFWVRCSRSGIAMPDSENAGLEALAFMLDAKPDLIHVIGACRSEDVTVIAIPDACEIGVDIGRIHPIIEADAPTAMRDLQVITITSALHCPQ
ncbi:hypothetical protein [Microvirga sp. TS319]|uniref:hypothetical protein n=1 Tax=Microvirga sp. TS319 TaxID=3241165 RepID=UPI003519EC40